MKIDLSAVLLSVDGKPIKKGPEEEDQDVTLGYALSFACLNADPRKHDNGEKKYRIWKILKQVTGKGTVSLVTEDVVLLKELVGESLGISVVGAVYDILEGTDEKDVENDEKGEDSTGGSG